MSRTTLRALILAVSTLLAACATRTPTEPVEAAGPEGDVAVRLLPPATEGSHSVQRGQAASGGAPIAEALILPDYPHAWLSRRLAPLTADALVVVDEQGRPARVEVDRDSLHAQCGECSDEFAAAVDTALRRWQFAPLEIADWVDGPDEDGDGEADSVTRSVVERRAYSLRMRFSFAVRDGRAVVEQLQ